MVRSGGMTKLVIPLDAWECTEIPKGDKDWAIEVGILDILDLAKDFVIWLIFSLCLGLVIWLLMGWVKRG